MKKIILLFYLISLKIMLFSQKDSIIIPNQSKLINGVKNHCLVVKNSKYDLKFRAINTNSLKVTSINQNEFYLTPYLRDYNNIEIELQYYLKNKLIKRDTQFLEVTNLNFNKVYLDGFINTEDLNELPNNCNIKVSTGIILIDEKLEFKIVKFRITIVNKSGPIIEKIYYKEECNNFDLTFFKDKIEPGALIIFDMIRLKSILEEKPINPIIYYFKKEPTYYNTIQNDGYLIKGFVNVNDTIKSINYNSYFYFKEKKDKIFKDSIWEFYEFDKEKKIFKLTRKDSFSKNKLIISYYYNGDRLSVIDNYLDTITYLTHYFKGEPVFECQVVENNNKEVYTYSNEFIENYYKPYDLEFNLIDTLYDDYLQYIPTGFFPINILIKYNDIKAFYYKFNKTEIKDLYLEAPKKVYKIYVDTK